MSVLDGRILAVTLLLALASGWTSVRGQELGGPGDDPPHRSPWTVWSLASPHDRIYLGMWTLHPFGDDPYPRESNNGFGLQYRSFFAFTCVNSFEKRTYAVGVERVWYQSGAGRLGIMVGYRAGLIRGYDTRLFEVAGKTPVLPFAGAVALLRLGPIGGEVSWVYRAVSLVGAVFL